MKEYPHNPQVVVVGAGLTGLTTAFRLRKAGVDVVVIEKQPRIGGQIRTYRSDGFVYESGPNTGAVSYPEVAELFEDLAPACELETAREESKCRLIWKGNKYHALPSGPLSAIATPLFTLADKFRILGEPWRSKGTNPDESIADMAARRLGRSFVTYAVDPFISGVYAGDPTRLCAKYAMPKLYNLEQQYGGFIKGSIAKAKQPKTERDLKATKQVFSARGGLSTLVNALADAIGRDRIILEVADVKAIPLKDKENGKTGGASEGYSVQFMQDGKLQTLTAQKIVTTVGAYELPELLPFVDESVMNRISKLYYAPIVQASVGYSDTGGLKYAAFGGLVPSVEKRDVLGMLFPSSCFEGRCPDSGALFSFFIGGVRHPEMLDMSDADLEALIRREAHDMLKFPVGKEPDLIKIFRHSRAIPQYRTDSGDRFAAVEEVQSKYPGLTIAGNLRGGIGMADRIRQANEIAAALS